jgi:ADP-heptose:LPS heptosyltransferase
MALGRRVVVLRALGLGDLLTALPALRGLRTGLPDARITLVVPRALHPLARLSGAVDACVAAPASGRGVPDRLPAALHGADIAVNLHGRGPQSTALLRSTRPRRLVAFGPPGPCTWREDEHEVRRWCRLLDEHGIPADPRRLELPAPPGEPPEGVAGTTLLHPGAATGARRWPVERWRALALSERRAGRAVAVSAGPGEEALAAAVGPRVVACRDPLALARAVAAADRVVCGDTGVAHLATALGTPSVVLFGPVPPAQWGPPGGGRHLALWTGRHGDPHADRPDPGLLEVGVRDVERALDQLGSSGSTDGGPSSTKTSTP